ncbi:MULTISPECIES: hypothetical protein [Acinetobacter]|nr:MULTISPECIES: hypothetical protein [Acinetobacter]MPW44321.1 hypothetical protein [Acinetobacter guerrae]HCA5312811.1 hypothetical protein [Acinetobacter baumannii]
MKSKFLLTFLFSTVTSIVYAGNDCGYSELTGTEYQITDQFKKYVTNSFDAFPKKNDYSQGSIRDYQSLNENSFKILNTGIRTLPSERYLQSFLSSYRFRNIDLDGTAYNLDKSFNTEVITSDCKKFYLDPGLTLKDIEYQIKRTDGQPIGKKDYFDLLGAAIEKKTIGVSSQYDKFEKRVEIKTEYFDKYLIRGYYDPSVKKVDFIQIYTDLTFIGDWGNISSSKDTDSQVHKVTRIDTNVDCKSKVLGCVLTETIGVDVTEQFLKNHKKGFEIKLMGKQSKVLSINGDVVTAFLEELNRVKTKTY